MIKGKKGIYIGECCTNKKPEYLAYQRKEQKSTITCGQPGTGRSFNVLDILKDLGVQGGIIAIEPKSEIIV